MITTPPLRAGPALVRWTVPEMTNSATFTFIANISAGCHTNIKMYAQSLKNSDFTSSYNHFTTIAGIVTEGIQLLTLTEVAILVKCCQ